MSVQKVTVVELDGQLGVLPDGQRALAIVAPASAGPLNTPAAFARTQDVVSNFTSGILVESACWHIQTKSLPVLLVRCAASTASTFDTIDTTKVTGSSVVTVNAGSLSVDDYEAYLFVSNGGTVGTTGITVQYSLDAGRTLSPPQALGTANNYTIPNSGSVRFNFAAGTLNTGDIVQCRFHGPAPSASDLTTALAALQNTAIDWEICMIGGALTTTSAAAVTTAFGGLPEKCWVGGVDTPSSAQTEATYLSSLTTAWAGVADSFCAGLCAGAAKFTSAVNGAQYAKPIITLYASELASVREHIDISTPSRAPLKGTYIADANGNPATTGTLLHDERLFPGLDSARFVVLNSYDGRAGAYVTNPNTFAAQGSDFQYAQHRRVMNKLKRTLRLYLEKRLSQPIFVSATTGFILETEAQDIEAGADEVCRAALTDQVSAGAYRNGSGFLQLSRTDNLLSTKTLNANGGAVPLAYPKAINLNVGYKNPALRVQPVPGS